MIQPTPTNLAWLCEYDGETPDGRPLWWCHVAWPNDRRHVSVTDQAPPDRWERPTQWVRDPTWPTAFVPVRGDGDDDG